MKEYRWFGKKVKKKFKKNKGYLSKRVFFKITVIIELDLKYFGLVGVVNNSAVLKHLKFILCSGF